MRNFKSFNPSRVALQKGISLVEASAGTGKTYALGMLVLRAIVEKKIPIDQILIVTYTKAATEELKGRIRARLVEAREALENGGEANCDQTLLDWVSKVYNPQEAAELLQLALYDIDRTAIFTIHGFCQRMLGEQALESNQLFDVELVTDIDFLKLQIAEDYWRQTVYPLDMVAGNLILEKSKTPAQLLGLLREAVRSQGDRVIVPADVDFEQEKFKLLQSIGELRIWWQTNHAAVNEQFSEAIEGGFFKAEVKNGFSDWFTRCSDFFSEKGSDIPESFEKFLQRDFLLAAVNKRKLKTAEAKAEYFSSWLLPEKELAAFIENKKRFLQGFSSGFLHFLAQELPRRLDARGQMGFDDLITRLAASLKGEGGERLVQQISDRYRLALIDEFQDTDSGQYTIFSTLFGKGKHLLYLIGDPKQAIYKFRGADIHSYFKARNEAKFLFTLDKNYRSHPNLVNEVNRIFQAREKPFRDAEDTLCYSPVRPARTEDDLGLEINGASGSGMLYCCLPAAPDSKKDGRWTSGKARGRIQNYIASEIVRLLQDDVVIRNEGAKRTLRCQDIAVLVRSNDEAIEYRNLLSLYGVPAVVTARESVFFSRECEDLAVLLAAVAGPSKPSLLKSALALSWFGFSGNELYALFQDEDVFGSWQEKMSDYFTLWNEHSFFTMITTFLECEGLLLNIATKDGAEQAIVNIYQLAERIQEEETKQNFSPAQTIHWLNSVRKVGSGEEDSELLLETDEDAVQIVTMHKSKGLEYSVVFCPSLWGGADFLAKNDVIVTLGSDGKSVVDLGSEQIDGRRKQAQSEQDAEGLRLLYVAITRAKLRCYLFWADVKKSGKTIDSFDSSLGYLLFPGGGCSQEIQQATIKGFCAEHGTQYVDVEEEVPHSYTAPIANGTLVPREYNGARLYTSYQISSFSALAGLSEYEHDGHAGDDRAEDAAQPVLYPGLPSGPRFGNVIHDLLENFHFRDLPVKEHAAEYLAEIDRLAGRYGVSLDSDEILELLKSCVQTRLPQPFPPQFCLADLSPGKCLKEMEFYFHLKTIETDEINRVLCNEPTVLPLGHKEMQGYLTGFIDLVCEADGKFYVIDYKTNNLGKSLQAYLPAKLTRAMQEHNYGLQFWIYSSVLHLHLQNIVPDYDYGQHFGGVGYLFLRGMSPEVMNVGVYATKPDFHTLGELATILSGR